MNPQYDTSTHQKKAKTCEAWYQVPGTRKLMLRFSHEVTYLAYKINDLF